MAVGAPGKLTPCMRWVGEKQEPNVKASHINRRCFHNQQSHASAHPYSGDSCRWHHLDFPFSCRWKGMPASHGCAVKLPRARCSLRRLAHFAGEEI